VRSNHVDAGMGIHAAARAFGLDFIPIAKERFDLIIPKTVFYTEPIQRLLDVTHSKDFAQKVEQMGGYDTRQTGQVLTWN
jgi:putative molybdopterin biosynthesis protein